MLRRLRLVLTLVCALLALAPNAAQAAKRQVPKGFFGVVADRWALDGTVPLDAQMRRMAAAGAETVGLNFPWVLSQPYRTLDEVPADQRARFQPAGPNGVPTDFRVIDRRVLAAAGAGLEVHPVVIAAPTWARLHPTREFSPPADPATYAAFATALVERYGPGGAFWAQHRGVHARPIREWQVWNEPVGGDGDATPSVFWQDDQPFQERYVALLRAAHAAIKAADPHARVVLGALVGRSWGSLKLIYDHGARGAFDAVALHPYTGRAADVIRIVQRVRGVMRRNGDRRKPIQVTELGWPAFDAQSVKRLGVRRANLAQAGWLRDAFRTLIARRRALGIDLVLWYTWIGRDASDRDAFDHSGLLRLGPGRRLTVKPALRAFKSIARPAEGRRR